jgi:DNA helicase HerA-like ATPase
MSLDINRLYNPNQRELGTLVSGLSGSGKTTAVISSLERAINSDDFGEYHRFVIIDPKHQSGDYDKLAVPIMGMKGLFKSIRRNRVTVFYPSLEDLENEVSMIISYIFMLSETEKESSFTFVLDEASILIEPTKIPTELKRLVVQGRAKNIKPVFISQRPIVNRWTDSNLSTALFFRILRTDADVLKRRWGIDFDYMAEQLLDRPYSFMYFDLETTEIQLMNPLPLPNSEVQKPEKWSKIFRVFE